MLTQYQPRGSGAREIADNLEADIASGELLPVAIGQDTVEWVESVMSSLYQSLECARRKSYLRCFKERPNACEACYDRTKAFCLRLRTAPASQEAP